MNFVLSKNVQTRRVSNAVSTGTGTTNSDIVDAQGFGGVRFVVVFGAMATGSTATLTLKHGDASDMSDETAVTGATHSMIDTDDNKIVIFDLNNLLKRYYRVTVVRATANSWYDSITCDLYKPSKLPTAAHSTADAVVCVHTAE